MKTANRDSSRIQHFGRSTRTLVWWPSLPTQRYEKKMNITSIWAAIYNIKQCRIFPVISWLYEDLLASQEGLCSKHLVSWSVGRKEGKERKGKEGRVEGGREGGKERWVEGGKEGKEGRKDGWMDGRAVDWLVSCLVPFYKRSHLANLTNAQHIQDSIKRVHLDFLQFWLKLYLSLVHTTE
jgi:hypothetical protein